MPASPVCNGDLVSNSRSSDPARHLKRRKDDAAMKLPHWIPQVQRPWNPAFGETWDAMTPNERRASFLIDIAICGVFLSLLAIFSQV